ncbi:MAG: hypothetical protein HYU74_12325 [Dechloromonas sp.]|nr:hypothetical protein [Dechloromonas sp.]
MIRSIIPLIVAGIAELWVPPVLAAEPPKAAEASQASEAWDNIRAYTLEKKTEAVAYGKKLMKETDARIDQLEVKAAQASGDAKVQYQKEMQELKAMRAKTAAKLDTMAKETGAAWDDTKQGFADAYKDLQHAYNKAARRFK